MTAYSRPYRVYVDDVKVGDLLDISATDLPCWAEVARVGACDEDVDEFGELNDCEYDGDCAAVVWIRDDENSDAEPWGAHLGSSVRVRFAADATDADIEAENDAHAAAHAAAVAARVHADRGVHEDVDEA